MATFKEIASDIVYEIINSRKSSVVLKQEILRRVNELTYEMSGRRLSLEDKLKLAEEIEAQLRRGSPLYEASVLSSDNSRHIEVVKYIVSQLRGK